MTCCAVVAARPPHSSGQRIAAQRSSLSLCCHALRLSIDAHDAARRFEVVLLVVGPLVDERRHLLVEERFELLFECKSSGDQAKSTKLTLASGSRYRPVRMDFTFSPDQERLRDCGARVPRQAKRRRSTCGSMAEHDDAGITPEVWRKIVDLGWTGVLVPEEHGGLGLGIVDAVVVQEEMGRAVFPGPYFSSAILATLAARALGLDDRLEALAAGTRARHGRARRSRLRRSARSRARARRGPRQPLQARRREADGDGRRERRLGARAGAHARWPADVPRRTAGDHAPTPSLDITRKFARIEFDGTRADAVGRRGDHDRIWRRVLDDAAVLLAAELIGVSRSGERARTRLRAGARRVRQAAVEVPGDAAQGGRHAAARSSWPRSGCTTRRGRRTSRRPIASPRRRWRRPSPRKRPTT